MGEVVQIHQPELVAPIIRYDVNEAQIAELRQRFGKITFDTPADYEEGRKAIATIRELRVAVEKKRVELKAASLEYGRRVDSVAKHLTAQLEAIEEPLKLSKAAVDEEKARAKAEAEAAKQRELEAKIRAEAEAREAELRAQREAEEQRRTLGASRRQGGELRSGRAPAPGARPPPWLPLPLRDGRARPSRPLPSRP